MTKKTQGYTMVELLAVIGLLSVITTIVVSVIFISLTGSKKTETVEVLRQNGDVALSQMIKTLRFAKTMVSPTSCTPAVTVSSITFTPVTNDGDITYSCENNTIASNSASLINTQTLTTKSCSFTCSQTSVMSPPTITIQFTLAPAAQSAFAETKAQLPFQSSVTLRNYSR